uniref:Uncharacterized protein n=1 Tax=Salix viminalis TaxID=40686 RepID=A0A6N2JYL0_SALVM
MRKLSLLIQARFHLQKLKIFQGCRLLNTSTIPKTLLQPSFLLVMFLDIDQLQLLHISLPEGLDNTQKTF